jgi:DNA-binding winged helix-turn-helix (wHTH) protein
MGVQRLSHYYQFLGYSVDDRQRTLSDPNGKSIRLSSRAYDTLLFLLKNHGKIVSKSQIMQAVWTTSIVEENNLNQAIFILRKILGDTRNNSQFILTIPGRGYCFIAQVNTTMPEKADSSFTKPQYVINSYYKLHAKELIFLTSIILAFIAGHFSSKHLNKLVSHSLLSTTSIPRNPDHEINSDTIRKSTAIKEIFNLDSRESNPVFTIELDNYQAEKLLNHHSLQVMPIESTQSLIEPAYSSAQPRQPLIIDP